jgi:hypothetical protein
MPDTIKGLEQAQQGDQNKIVIFRRFKSCPQKIQIVDKNCLYQFTVKNRCKLNFYIVLQYQPRYV